jgi:hypothetical protein
MKNLFLIMLLCLSCESEIKSNTANINLDNDNDFIHDAIDKSPFFVDRPELNLKLKQVNVHYADRESKQRVKEIKLSQNNEAYHYRKLMLKHLKDNEDVRNELERYYLHSLVDLAQADWSQINDKYPVELELLFSIDIKTQHQIDRISQFVIHLYEKNDHLIYLTSAYHDQKYIYLSEQTKLKGELSLNKHDFLEFIQQGLSYEVSSLHFHGNSEFTFLDFKDMNMVYLISDNKLNRYYVPKQREFSTQELIKQIDKKAKMEGSHLTQVNELKAKYNLHKEKDIEAPFFYLTNFDSRGFTKKMNNDKIVILHTQFKDSYYTAKIESAKKEVKLVKVDKPSELTIRLTHELQPHFTEHRMSHEFYQWEGCGRECSGPSKRRCYYFLKVHEGYKTRVNKAHAFKLLREHNGKKEVTEINFEKYNDAYQVKLKIEAGEYSLIQASLDEKYWTGAMRTHTCQGNIFRNLGRVEKEIISKKFFWIEVK